MPLQFSLCQVIDLGRVQVQTNGTIKEETGTHTPFIPYGHLVFLTPFRLPHPLMLVFYPIMLRLPLP